MKRLLVIGLTVAMATVVGDAFFRASLLRSLRPVIEEPPDGATVDLPVRVRWEGPQKMRVILRFAGRERWEVGIHQSPLELPRDYFSERGLYHVEIRSPRFGTWISDSRSFAVKETPATVRPEEQSTLSAQLAALQRSLFQLRQTQDEMRDENTELYEENAAIREENAILTEELHRLAEAEQRAAGRTAALEQQHGELLETHRSLLEETNALRLRMADIVPCTVWGYFSFPRPQTIPATRRRVTVSNDEGEVFRTQTRCERVRRGDPTSSSPCFCVGNSFGG
jgi:hypothetical protein